MNDIPKADRTWSPMRYPARDAVVIDEPLIPYIFNGRISLILRRKKKEYIIGKECFLASPCKCYGVIKITGLDRLNYQEFKKNAQRHYITERERLQKYRDLVEFWAYSFEIVKLFDTPLGYCFDEECEWIKSFANVCPQAVEEELVMLPDVLKFIFDENVVLVKDYIWLRHDDKIRLLFKQDSPISPEFDYSCKWRLIKSLKADMWNNVEFVSANDVPEGFEPLYSLVLERVNKINKVFAKSLTEKVDVESAVIPIVKDFSLDVDKDELFNMFRDGTVRTDYVSLAGDIITKSGTKKSIDFYVRDTKGLPDWYRKSVHEALKRVVEAYKDRVCFNYDERYATISENIPLYNLSLKKIIQRDMFFDVQAIDDKTLQAMVQ